MRLVRGWVIGLTFVTCVVQAQTPAPDDPLLDSSGSANASSEARGVLRARNQAVLASELSGRFVELPFSEGESFKKGDTLARFDCSAYQAQLNAARLPAVVPVKSCHTTSNWRR